MLILNHGFFEVKELKFYEKSEAKTAGSQETGSLNQGYFEKKKRKLLILSHGFFEAKELKFLLKKRIRKQPAASIPAAGCFYP